MGMKRMHVEHVAGMRNLVAQRKVVGVQATARIASARSRRASLNAPAHGNVGASKTSRSGSMMVARASLQWCRHERSANLKRQLEAAFVSSTEGVRNGTWEAVADDATCARICQTMAAAQQQVQHSITRLMRAIDTDRDEETSLVTAWGLNADEQEKQARYRQQALLQAAMYAPTAEPDGLTSASGTSSTDRDCNFCATGATGKDIAKTVTTPTPRGDTVHAVVYYENDDGTLELGGAQISNLEAPQQAPVETLRIPYRSMSAKVCVWVSEGKCMNVRSIVDSGAAQCAVSSKWLRQFPELWNARRAATHKFHGLTGEPLHTDGAVRLSFRMGTHTVSAWFHVFTNMHSPMLLGTNALIENRLVIDGADQQLYAKGVKRRCVRCVGSICGTRAIWARREHLCSQRSSAYA
jgi:hypothetical protein